MKIRFQADADIDPDIRKGLLRREGSIDFRTARGVIPDGAVDPDVLTIAADDDRVRRITLVRIALLTPAAAKEDKPLA